jgi:chemotaxis protein histidine kinase CheA/ActR/RegA family two-component response regulator
VGMRNMSNSFDKLSILESFIEEVNSYLPEIETNLEHLAQSPGDMDALEETHRRTHSIGGAASMMDFPGLAHVAHGMEAILEEVKNGMTTLDGPTVDLLRRSFRRLHQLLEGIRTGIDEEAIVAEDDDDYAQYRAQLESLTQTGAMGATGQMAPVQARMETAPEAQFSMPPTPAASAIPSFDEVLASFRTPSLTPGEDVAWPEEPTTATHFEELEQLSPLSPGQDSYRAPAPPMPHVSALDELVASTKQMPAISSASSPASAPSMEGELPTQSFAEAPVVPDMPLSSMSNSAIIQPAELTTANDRLPAAYSDMQRDAHVLEGQIFSLKDVLSQLRSSIMIIETQRKEFKSFLDGSKDALDRMEDWAGAAMGLNLRNSPDQVRRYLPLSVMWVSNSKLKKVLDSLNQIADGTQVTDDQMNAVMQQLHSSIAACGDAFLRMQENAARILRQEPGWTAWEMQEPRQDENVRERVTFERRGDVAAIRAELETKLREEIRHEYESRPTTVAMRSELEQQIRREVRQEFEAKRRLQDRVTGGSTGESLQELEMRLRNEIEIQVRQEFLTQISAEESERAQRASVAREEIVSAPANFVDMARDAVGRSEAGMMNADTSPRHPAAAQERHQNRHVAPLQSTPASEKSFTSSTSNSSNAFGGDFGEEAAEIFRLEAEEHLQTISVHVAALEKDPTNRDLIQGIRRATHTLKGAAAMMGFRAIADLCHISEDLLDSIMEGGTSISPAVLSIVLDTAETLDGLITGRGADAVSDEARVEALRVRYTELLGERTIAPRNEEEDLEEDPEVLAEPVGGMAHTTGVVLDDSDQATPNAETHVQRGTRGDLNVRVRLQKLDELVNLFGELLVNRSVLEERIQRLVRLVADVGVSSNRLRDVGQKLESRFEAATLPSGRSVVAMPGEGDQSLLMGPKNGNGRSAVEPEHLAEFDELELDRYTEFHQIARGLSEGISDMSTLSAEMDAIIRECEGVFARENRLSTTFQDRLMKVRLVPLATMTPRLYRAARAVALKQRKEFEFLLEGEDTEVDRTVFEEIAGPLLHLMRNAVNHAIETPDVRMQKGKSPAGQIKLSAGYEGNQVVITVRDDGIGVDPEHVRNAAVSRGLIRPDQPLSDGDLIDLIFRPGFSTAEVLSEESGRGVGLDVVRDSVSRLRGTLEVESTPGQGTAFTMKFPTSLAIQSAMMVRVGNQQFAIPTLVVEAIGRLDNFKRSTLGGQPAVLIQNELYPLQPLGPYLTVQTNIIDDKAQLMIVNAGSQHVALIVDEIKGKFDIVMKNLGPHLRHVHGIAGATVLGNGHVVLVLELSELLASRSKFGPAVGSASAAPVAPASAAPTRRETTQQSAVKQNIDLSAPRQSTTTMRAVSAPASPPIPERGKHILVVDDSPSVRRVVSSMLKQNNWEVQTARDGVEALEMISYETPAAVLLDIEMPRMDGYELIATIRSQEMYRTLPLVVLTSRAAGKHQQRAMQLGASAYVVKPYQDEELLSTLSDLVYGAAATR